jgi:predicted helicase
MTPPTAEPLAAPPRTRRLSDKILVAFHQACDQADFEIAQRLIGILETMGSRATSAFDRRHQETFVQAHRRLWDLRHPVLFDNTARGWSATADGQAANSSQQR